MILIEYIFQNLYVILWLDKVITDALRAYLMFFVRFWNCTGFVGTCDMMLGWPMVIPGKFDFPKYLKVDTVDGLRKPAPPNDTKTDAWNRKKML